MADNKKTDYIQLKGTASWAKVFEQNRDKKGPDGVWEDEGGRCTIKLHLSEDEVQKYKDAGGRKQPKTDAEGLSIQFDRKWEAPYNYGGAPQVVHADGTPWDIQEDGLIGNGSEVVVYLSLYGEGKYRGTRLDGVQILEHVEYEMEGQPSSGGIPFKDYTKSEQKVSGKKAPPKKKAPVQEDMDDEIPF